MPANKYEKFALMDSEMARTALVNPGKSLPKRRKTSAKSGTIKFIMKKMAKNAVAITMAG